MSNDSTHTIPQMEAAIGARCTKCGHQTLACRCPGPDLSSHRRKLKHFDFNRLTVGDRAIVARYLGPVWFQRAPDVVIDSDHNGPYLWRWHIQPRTDQPGQYLHIQTSSDPERPLHDHPCDNMSCILSGGYDEIVQMEPPFGEVRVQPARVGTTVFRRAEFAHRLVLPEEIPYTISLFTMGQRRRLWGFWIDGTWYEFEKCTRRDPQSQQVFFKDPTTTEAAC